MNSQGLKVQVWAPDSPWPVNIHLFFPFLIRYYFCIDFLCAKLEAEIIFPLSLSLPAEKCDEALASSLPHTAFTSSSVFSNGYAPGYAKLNRRGGRASSSQKLPLMECNDSTVRFRSPSLFLFNLPSGWIQFRIWKLVESRIRTQECRIKHITWESYMWNIQK